MSDEEKKLDAPPTGVPETEVNQPATEEPQAQQPAVDPADKPASAEPPAATENPAPAAETPAPAGQPAATEKPPAPEKPARPAAPAKPAAGTAAKPAAAKPAGKPAAPPDPRVEAAKAKAEELKAALDAHFFQSDSSVRAITVGAVERTAAADAVSNDGQPTTAAAASSNDAPTPTDAAAGENAAAHESAADAAPTDAAANDEAGGTHAAEAPAAKPSVVVETGAAVHTPVVVIDKKFWRDAVEFLRTDDNWKLNYIEMMAGTDYPDKGYIEVVVYVQSTSLGHWVCLKTRADRQSPILPSLVPSHPGVNWEEREIYDLLGVTFTDHPDLRRIMMWDEYQGHPLRKDFNEWEVGEDADGSSR